MIGPKSQLAVRRRLRLVDEGHVADIRSGEACPTPELLNSEG